MAASRGPGGRLQQPSVPSSHRQHSGQVTPSVTCHGARPSSRPVTSGVRIRESGRPGMDGGASAVSCILPTPPALRSGSEALPLGQGRGAGPWGPGPRVLGSCHPALSPSPREARVPGPAFAPHWPPDLADGSRSAEAHPSWWGPRGHRASHPVLSWNWVLAASPRLRHSADAPWRLTRQSPFT